MFPLYIYVYRDRDYSSESNMYSEASGGEEPPTSYEGHTPWTKPSNFTPKAGDNEALEDFLMQVYQDLFNPQKIESG